MCSQKSIPRQIDHNRIRGAEIVGGKNCPKGKSANCPYCGVTAFFRLSQPNSPNESQLSAQFGSCPDCGKNVDFVFVFEKQEVESKNIDLVAAYLLSDGSRTISVPKFPKSVPTGIVKAVERSILVYNAGVYSSTATEGRRALEGLFKSIKQTTGNKSLAQLIENVSKDKASLAEPLIKLSHAVREGGNLGAHFDENEDADAETARLIVELIVYLINYFFDLPEHIDKLERRVKKPAMDAVEKPNPNAVPSIEVKHLTVSEL